MSEKRKSFLVFPGIKKASPVVFALAGASLMCACQPAVELAKHTFTMELGADVYANPSIYLMNPDAPGQQNMEVDAVSVGIARIDNRFVTLNSDYLVIGEYDFVLKNGFQEIPFVIKVKDTRAPAAVVPTEPVTIARSSSVDWASILHASDLSGVYYELVSGDPTIPGEQDMVVRISDRFGNAIEHTIHVVVQG